MANTGHDWGAFAFVQLAAGNWDAIAQGDDDAADVSDAITVDTKSAIIIGYVITEDNTGAVVANSVTIAVLGTFNDTIFEDAPGLAGAQVGNPFKFQVTPVQNDTVVGQFSIDPRDYNLLKIAALNESGQELDISFKIKNADVPVAS